MNDALQKFLNLTRANFWDWQFYAFIIFSAIIPALYLLEQKSTFKISKLLKFAADFTGKSDFRNYLLVAAVSGSLCFLLALIAGIPAPQTHDEFGYLLAADTFLQGRIVNPTPFSPPHFEYFHILLKPIYAAKYPPLQGTLLAVGTLFSDYPIAGVWLSSVLASLAVYWFLRYFFSPAWSVYGAFLWIFAPLNILWCDSYWGGHAAVIGGALSLGAFLRFLKSKQLKYLFIWGAGVFLLLNSRLYEGALLTGILVFLWFFETLKNNKFEKTLFRTIAVFALIIAANLLFLALYNYSVTGNPSVLPYRLHHSQYHRTPLFVFQNLDEPKPNAPPVVRKLDERWTADFQERYKNWTSALVSTISRIPIYIFWLTRSPFLIALFMAGRIFSFRKEEGNQWKIVQTIFGLFLIGLFLPTFTGDRFVAPIIGIFIAAATFAAKIIYKKSNLLRLWVLSLPFIIGAGFLYGMIPLKSDNGQTLINTDNIGSRPELESYLKRQPGKHLLFLETSDALPADARFYVYNRADIENAEIIWAHKLTDEENAALIDHYKDRSVWLLKNVNYQAILVRFENQSGRQDLSK